jgi:caffeoyl-CoA O-methyltransferase
VRAASTLTYSSPMRRINLDRLRRRFIARFRRIEMNTAPGDAAFLRILVESSRAKRGLEIGTANGYGAIHLGMAFERNGGKLTSIDVDSTMIATARRNIEKVGLQDTAQFIEGPALDIIPTLKGKFDFVFLDAVKQDYLAYLRAIEPKLKPGALVVADNVIQFAEPMRDFLEYVTTSPRYHTVTLRASMDKNDGMTVSYRL